MKTRVCDICHKTIPSEEFRFNGDDNGGVCSVECADVDLAIACKEHFEVFGEELILDPEDRKAA